MKITAESTQKIVQLNGIPARIWEATTESGVPCHLYVTRIAVDRTDDTSQFERELQEHKAPTPEIAGIPFRMIL